MSKDRATHGSVASEFRNICLEYIKIDIKIIEYLIYFFEAYLYKVTTTLPGYCEVIWFTSFTRCLMHLRRA